MVEVEDFELGSNFVKKKTIFKNLEPKQAIKCTPSRPELNIKSLEYLLPV